MNLPQRNQVLLAGDFNTSLVQRSSSVGFADFRGQGSRAKGSFSADAERFHDILQTLDLQALNTWSADLGPTFHNDYTGTRIDFLCSRRQHADSSSKDVLYLTAFPLLPLQGTYHVPLITTVPRKWYTEHHRASSMWTREQRIQLHQEWVHNNPNIQRLQTAVKETLRDLDPETLLDDYAGLNHQLLQATQPGHKHKDVPVHLHVVSPSHTLQQHMLALRHLHGTQVSALFSAWRHVTQITKARHIMKAGAKSARKRKLSYIFQVAADAEEAKDHHRLYQAIRKLAPKQKHKRIQLRSETGELLDPQRSADMMAHWLQQQYDAPSFELEAIPFQWPFTVQDMTEGLHHLPGDKALDPSYAPATLWKLAAEPIAQHLEYCSHHWQTTLRFPSSSGQGHLVFLPKPNKKGQHPSELRPIALLEPTGKMLMGLLAQNLKLEVWPALRVLPQFAYLPKRGCADAIARLSQHCHLVRSIIEQQSLSIHQQAHGLRRLPVSGGIVISLDMSKAFDMVDRQFLFSHLERLGVTSSTLNMLKGIYQCTSFHFEHAGEHRHCPTFKGIRQGCKAAPILWCCFTSALLHIIADLTSWQWMTDHLTIYADDITIYQTFTEVDQIQEFLRRVGVVLDVLEQCGMVLNPEKSTAICRLTGPQVALAYKKCMHRTKTAAFLNIPRRDHSITHIRLTQQLSYLGIILNYRKFEDITMKVWLQASERAQHQLHRWLHDKHVMRRASRIKLWRQCVLTCSLYGLLQVGLTTQGLKHFFGTCLKQLRRIYKEPVFITRQSHLDFLAVHGLDNPLIQLHSLGVKQMEREIQRQMLLDPDDILHTIDPLRLNDSLQCVAQYLQNMTQALQQTSQIQDIQNDLRCPHCHCTFLDNSQFRRHLTVQHGQRGGWLRTLDATEASQGLPTCIRCQQKFTTWSNFKYHIQFVCTHSIPTQELMMEQEAHRLKVTELLTYVTSNRLEALQHDQRLKEYFTKHCALCSQVCLTARGFLHHWSTQHHDLYTQHGQHYDRLHDSVLQASPCLLCDAQYQQKHACVMIRQIALILTQQDAAPPPVPHVTPRTWKCQQCHKAYTTKHGLKKHLRLYHTATQAAADLISDTDSETLQCVWQAVAQEQYEHILTNDAVIQLLTTRCILCSKGFNHQRYLTRHLREHHVSDREHMDKHATLLDNMYKTGSQCFCRPRHPQRRQFAPSSTN